MKRAMAVLLCVALVALAQVKDAPKDAAKDGAKDGGKKPPPPRDAKGDQEALQGEWKVVGLYGPHAADKRKEDVDLTRFIFAKGELRITGGTGKEPPVKYVLNAKKEPREIDIVLPGAGKKLLGAYKFDKDRSGKELLVVGLPKGGGERPVGIPRTAREFAADKRVTWFILQSTKEPKKDEGKKDAEKKDGPEK